MREAALTATTRPSFPGLLAALLLVKLLLAAWVPPFGDEVFYWQEGRHLASGYTDLPLLTAWLVRAGCFLLGDNLLGMRIGFVLCGVATVAVLLHWWRERMPADAGIGAWIMAVPLLVLSGQLATPDAPLTLAFIVAARSLDRALDDNGWRNWLLFALAFALAWLTHWRAALLYPVGLLLLTISPRALVAVRGGRFWVAQLLGLLGLLPTLWFNAQNDWAAFKFQAIERHAWQFDAMSLLQPLEQAATLGVLMYPVLLLAMWRAWRRRRESGFDVIVAMSIGVSLTYFVVGLFADAERTRFHWPLPAYLPLVLMLPAMTRDWQDGWRKRLSTSARVAAYSTALLVAAVLVSFNFVSDQWPPGGDRRLGESFLGWDQAARATDKRLRSMPADTVLVADNFLLAAQLDFAFAGRQPIYVLDHPRNVKHGRQKQLALWQRDQAALLTTDAEHLLLVVEENALYAAEVLPFYRHLCDSFAQVRYVDDLALFGTAKRFVWLELRPGLPPDCRLPPLGHVDSPSADMRVKSGAGFVLSGWVVREALGIDQFEVRIDGRVDPTVSQSFGIPANHVRDVWPDLRDRRWPNVGFYADSVGRDLAPGAHDLEVRAQADGVWRLLAKRRVVVDAN